MPVDSKHPDLAQRDKDYTQISDCIAGQRQIKSKGDVYLPRPNSADTSEDNKARFREYLSRAVFYNVTARTVENMVGQCFAVDPVATMPDTMLQWLNDIDGAGVSADQQTKSALSKIVAISRAALWVDYPKNEGVISLADAETKGIRPKIILLNAGQVINWRVVQIGAKTKLSLVVIEEPYQVDDDGFEIKTETQYRVLRLVEGIYTIEIYRKTEKGQWLIVPAETVVPTKGDNSTWDEIPFTFIGAMTNDSVVEKPLMLDISDLNVAHYRNSADYEETTYICGQPTLAISGLTREWIDGQMKGRINLGSRGHIPLPKDGKAELLQAEANALPKEAMDQKEKQMAALGAKLIEKSEVAVTATEKGLNEASETSVLSSCCHNVSKAYSMAFRWAAQYADIVTNDPEKEILYELNTDFAIARMSPEEVGAVINSFNGKLITYEEARDKLKTGGFAYLDDDEAKDQLEEDAEAELVKAQKELEMQTKSQVEIQGAKKPAAPNAPPAQ